jgi:hypothetical protein
VPSLHEKFSKLLLHGKSENDEHKHSWRGVIFKNDLVDDTRPRLPEFNAIFTSCALQKVENLLIRDKGSLSRSEIKRILSIVKSGVPPDPAWRHEQPG